MSDSPARTAPMGGKLLALSFSSVGSKVVTAITGLGLSLFIVGHLAGNLLAFAGPATFNAYSSTLQGNQALVWTLRSILLVGISFHIVMALRANRLNARARPVGYAYANRTPAVLGAKTMVVSGLVVLVFLVYHLLHFTGHVVGPQPDARLADGHHDAYRMLVLGFQNPLIAGLYIVGQLLLSQHLSHGLYSLFQHLGLHGSKFSPSMRASAQVIGVAISLAFISIPVAVLAGVIQ